ncbi:hypothetical protein BsWGS_18519 [Bradybaena similaris]
MVSTRTTYILWFTLGWLGIHHLYLGRLYQALVWFATAGGGCGLGWIRDAWRIPAYVQWCNPDKQMRRKYAQRAVSKTKPQYSTFRSLGMTFMGYITSKALSCLIPDYSDLYTTDAMTYYFMYMCSLALSIIGNAVGIYLVANIGELKCSFKYILTVSACIIPIFVDITSSLGSSISTWILTSTGLKWRHPQEEKQSRGSKKTLWIHISLYTVACLTWLVIVSVGFYFNGQLEIHGEKMSGKEIISNVKDSEAWQILQTTLYEIYKVYNQTGLWGVWQGISAHFTFTEKIKAYWTLGIRPGTSSEDISKRCRKLLAENHPDRFRLPEERQAAEVKYVQINHACSHLTESRSRKLQDEEL